MQIRDSLLTRNGLVLKVKLFGWQRNKPGAFKVENELAYLEFTN